MSCTVRNSLMRTFLACASTLALAACGGGSGGGNGTNGVSATSAPPPPILNGQTTTQAQLTGSAIRFTDFSTEVVNVAGSLNNRTGALAINDGLFNFVDNTGPDSNGIFRSGTAALTTEIDGFREFDFVFPYVQIYTLRGVEVASFGVAGIATDPANVPNTGSATFSGDSFGFMFANNGATEVSFQGNSVVNANFGAGLVNVEMSGVRVESLNSQPPIAPADTIRISNMTINGNGFSGGKVATLQNGASVDLTGANTTSIAQGHFYGQTANGGPDEVGGNMISIGSTGAVTATFIAD